MILKSLVDQARASNVELDRDILGYAIKGCIDNHMERLRLTPDDLALLSRSANLTEVVHLMSFEANLWKTQNLCFQMIKNVAPDRQASAIQENEVAKEWLRHFNKLCDNLGFKVNR
jgi:hypothetical protein